MKPIGIIVLCVVCILVLLVGAVFFFRSKKPKEEGETKVVNPQCLKSLSLWRDVPLSKKVPTKRPQGPYFPIQKTEKVIAFDEVLSDAECAFLIQATDKALTPDASEGIVHIKKESTPWVNFLEKRLATILQTHPGKLETLQLHRYKRGSDVTHPHLDVIDKDDPAGQRMSTLIVFLNDLPELEEGGRTIFSRLNGGLRPKKGTAIGWNNVDLKTKVPDEDVVHTGEPLYLKKSTKYILIGWSRQRAYEDD